MVGYWLLSLPPCCLHPARWGVRLDCSNLPKSSRTEGNMESLPCHADYHWQSWDPLPQLVASESPKRWRGREKRESWWAQALWVPTPQRSLVGMTNAWTQSMQPLGDPHFLGWSSTKPFLAWHKRIFQANTCLNPGPCLTPVNRRNVAGNMD